MPTDAKDINSVGCIQQFWLYQACGRTCTVEKKDVAHYKGQRFHAASKVLVDAWERAEAQHSN